VEELQAVDLETAEQRYREASATPCTGGPWKTLTGAGDDAARHFALNLVTVARAQRDARTTADGIAIGIPLAGSGEVADIGATLWIDLLRTAAGESPLPTVVIREPREYLCLFYRPLEGSDLASLLGKVFDRFDEIDQPWQTLPDAASTDGASLDRFVSSGPAPLAELVSRLQLFEAR
jgi:hypothetical protein